MISEEPYRVFDICDVCSIKFYPKVENYFWITSNLDTNESPQTCDFCDSCKEDYPKVYEDAKYFYKVNT